VPASRWRPWQVPHVLLGHQDVPCAGCRAKECPFGSPPCLEGITASSLADAVELLTKEPIA
jgi:hypothetical protein